MLKVTTEPQEKCQVLLTVEVDEQQKDKLLKAAAQRISKQFKIPGFRPGKAPYRVVAQRVGEETIRSEAVEDLSQSVFKEALKQADLEPYAPASLEDVTWEPLVMKVRVPTAPVIELGDYHALRLESLPVEVGEEEVERALEGLREEYASWKPVERAAQLGDLLTMAVTARVGDEVLTRDEEAEFELVEVEEGSSQPDLTSPLIGLSAGDEKEFSVTYPQTASDARYAGQEVTYTVEVHSVKEKELYPLDDDFAQTVGDFDDLQQLRQKLTENIRRQKQREADHELGEKALAQVLEDAKRIEWPSVLEEEEIDRALEEQDRRLQQQGLNLDTYLSMQKETREQLREQVRPAVQDRLRRTLALGRLVELENLSVAGHEVTDQIDRLSMLGGEQRGELRQALSSPGNVRHIFNDLLVAKATERLVQLVKGEPEAAERQEEGEVEREADKEVEAGTMTEAGPETEIAAEKEIE